MLFEIAREAERLHSGLEVNLRLVESILPRTLDAKQVLETFIWWVTGEDSGTPLIQDMKRSCRGEGSTEIFRVLAFESPDSFDTDTLEKVQDVLRRNNWALCTLEAILYYDTRLISTEDMDVLKSFYNMERTENTTLSACAYNAMEGGCLACAPVMAHKCGVNNFVLWNELMAGIHMLWSGAKVASPMGYGAYKAMKAAMCGNTSLARSIIPNPNFWKCFAAEFLAESDGRNLLSGHNFCPTRDIKMFERLRQYSGVIPYCLLLSPSEHVAQCANWAMEDYFITSDLITSVYALANDIIAGRDSYEVELPNECTIGRDDFVTIARSLAGEHTVRGNITGWLAIQALLDGSEECAKSLWASIKPVNLDESFMALKRVVL